MKPLMLIVALVAALSCTAAAQTPGTRTGTRGFNVVLLLGEEQIAAPPEGVPEAARKALADMKDFLPYKSYRVLDSQWIAADDDATNVTSRLRGINGQELYLHVHSTQRPNGILVTFSLADARVGPPAPLIDTSFNMSVGETVVVGTSRVQGDKALIVLLTAVSRAAQPAPSSGERSVFVTGEIRMPGRLTYQDGMTVQHAIERSGGVAERAADRIELRRLVNGNKTTIQATLATPLLPNDIVSIPRR